jgi:hypothetical protein
LFEKARKEKLLFYTNYSGAIFSPDELEKEQAEGYCIWGPEHWQLVCPAGIKVTLEHEIYRANKEYRSFLERLKAAGYEVSGRIKYYKGE